MQVEESTYKASGVDIDKADLFISKIKPLAQKTHRPGVLKGIGGFGALFHIDFHKYKDPVLVASTDGVGTKLKIAVMAKRHETIGIDLVAMSVNDLLAMGAEPLFFLDYFATSKLNMNEATEIMKGIVDGCLEAGCALIGGETAEMPSLYAKGDYDLAGFAVGIVEKDKVIDGTGIRFGDSLIGLASNGLHSNGFSLVRKIFFEKLKFGIHKRVPQLGGKLSEILLTPTRIYVRPVLPLLKRFPIHGMVHVTGGGFMENIPRILPQGAAVEIKKGSWPAASIFKFLQSRGNIAESEMFRTFNCGIGYILIVPQQKAQDVVNTLKNMGQPAYVMGTVVPRKGSIVVFK